LLLLSIIQNYGLIYVLLQVLAWQPLVLLCRFDTLQIKLSECLVWMVVTNAEIIMTVLLPEQINPLQLIHGLAALR